MEEIFALLGVFNVFPYNRFLNYQELFVPSNSALTIVVAHKNLSQIIDSSALTIVVAHKNLSQIIDSSA
jgi:hypothetical protein